METNEIRVVITKNQYYQLKQIFENNNIDCVVWRQSSPSGIGPNVTVEYDGVKPVKLDITDIDSW